MPDNFSNYCQRHSRISTKTDKRVPKRVQAISAGSILALPICIAIGHFKSCCYVNDFLEAEKASGRIDELAAAYIYRTNDAALDEAA